MHFLKKILSSRYVFIGFGVRGTERGRKRKKHGSERETLIGCLPHAPRPGMEPAN